MLALPALMRFEGHGQQLVCAHGSVPPVTGRSGARAVSPES